MNEERRSVPVRVYESDKRIMVAAPLPGLEPTDIGVSIRGDTVAIQGDYRGPLKEDPSLQVDDPTAVVLAEWEIGPYYREVSLPHPVDGALSNATYGNGVLVLVMPKQNPDEPIRAAEFRLEVTVAPRGERVGHMGRDIQPTSNQEHRRKVHNTDPPSR